MEIGCTGEFAAFIYSLQSRFSNYKADVLHASADVAIEPESDTTNSDNRGTGTELLAKTADVRVDSATEFRALSFPHNRHNLFASDNGFGSARKEIKEVEFLASYFDELAPEAHLAPGEVYAQWSARSDSQARLRRAGAAHDSFDASHEFTKPIWFDQAVIRTGLKAKNPLQFGAAIGDSDDGGVGRGPDAAANLQTVEIRKIKIEQHKIGAVMCCQRVCSGIGTVGIVAVLP